MSLASSETMLNSKENPPIKNLKTKLDQDKGNFKAWHILNIDSQNIFVVRLSTQKTHYVLHEDGMRSLVRVEHWLLQHGLFLFVFNNMNYMPNNTLSNWLDRIDVIKSRSKQMNWKDESKTLEKRLNIRINWTKGKK